jgi:hypothetical protein
LAVMECIFHVGLILVFLAHAKTQRRESEGDFVKIAIHLNLSPRRRRGLFFIHSKDFSLRSK